MPSGGRIPPEVEARIPELRAQGKLYREIASELGISAGPVKRVLNPKSYRRKLLRQRESPKSRENRNEVRSRRRVFTVRVTINGKRKGFQVDGRRPKPGRCEFCHEEVEGRELGWHHWDDNHLEYGLWLCFKCHYFAEMVEKGLTIIRYEGLKNKAVRGELV